jgi:hypothetical protein
MHTFRGSFAPCSKICCLKYIISLANPSVVI